MSVIFSGADVKIDGLNMLKNLVIQTLVPLLFGIALQGIGPVKKCVTSWKKVLGKCSNCCIFFVVWLNTSGSQDNTGTMIVPCIMSHFSQLMIDGFLADRWKLDD